jgi:hypothetical protein
MGNSGRFGLRTDSATRAGAFGVDRGTLISAGIAVTAAGALAAVALTAGGSALAAGRPGTGARLVAPDAAATVTTAPPSDGYQFVELGSHNDRGYNQLLGINNHGRIAGFFGSGAQGHPSKGYTINAPYAQGDIKSENFPGSAQTAVEGLNDNNVQVGYYSTQNKVSVNADNSFGWYFNGKFHKVVFPAHDNAKPTFDQLDSVNNHDVAVGFYENSAGRDRGYAFNIKTGKFSLVTKPGAPTGGNAPSLDAFGINNAGDVVGDFKTSGGMTDAFLKLAGGAFHTIAVPGATETIALGVNDNDTVVGGYVASGGTIHGFIWRIGGSLSTDVDDPNALDYSLIDGVNNAGDIVGSYEDSHGFHGFLAYPAF